MNKRCISEIRLIFDTSFKENVKARILDEKLSNIFRKQKKKDKIFRSQFELFSALNQFHKDL